MANPNPSPETRFGGPRANPGSPGGKTGEQLKIDREAADLAAKIRHKMLSALAGKIEDAEDPLEHLDANALKLFKDSEDRAHGTPKATSEVSGPEGGPIPVSKVTYEIFDPKREGDST